MHNTVALREQVFELRCLLSEREDLPRIIPSDVTDMQVLNPEGTDVTIYSFTTSAGKPTAIAYVGKQSKPKWYYNFRSEGERQKYIDREVEAAQTRVKSKSDRLRSRREFQHDYKVGDILVSSWGYEQTNVDWYEVTAIKGKQVEIREIAGKVVDYGQGSDKVVPVPGDFVGAIKRKTPGQYGIRLTTYSSAHKWDGKPQHQTSAGYGH